MFKKDYVVPQVLLVIIVFAAGYYFCSNAVVNLTSNHISSGFGFLDDPTGFDIIMHLIPYSPESTYLRLFIVGILNTVLLSVLSIIFSTIIGFIIGVARLSKNWLTAKAASIYVETFRNLPLLLQILFWYYIMLHYLPSKDNTWHIGEWLSLNIRGLIIFGVEIIPELIAMLLSLSFYSASYIAENIRAGILSVNRGQTEAALALGFNSWQILRLIIVPQALRVVVPPLTSQYLSIMKNSSLSAIIGYPDLVAVFAGTALNQTGQAVETIFMVMSVYLSISLIISYFMNLYNRKIILVGDHG